MFRCGLKITENCHVLVNQFRENFRSNPFIKPLFKSKGNVSDPDNYRGITLLSCFGKLFTNVINCRLTDFLNTFNAIGTEQAGFKAGLSTVDHMFVLKSLVDIYLSRNRHLYCCFVDYRKAFDTVNRSKLWSKILSLNINGKLFNVVHNIYSQAKSCVCINSTLSNLFPCSVGVRQSFSTVIFHIPL